MPLHPVPRYNGKRGSQRPIRALDHGLCGYTATGGDRNGEGFYRSAQRGLTLRYGGVAERIERAVNLVGGSHPAYDAGVTFLIDPEGCFVEDPAAQARKAGFDRLGAMVA